METIEKAFEVNNVAVLLTSSDADAPYSGVVVESIVENSSRENNYDIIIFETDISEKNKTLLKKICGKTTNVSLRFVDVSEIMEQFKFRNPNIAAKKQEHYCLAALSALPEYDKIIALDNSLIVNCDIAELYNTELGENYLAAAKCLRTFISCHDTKVHKSSKTSVREFLSDKVGLKDPDNYFNSGVMLLNLSNLRKDHTSDRLLELASDPVFSASKQDLLNSVCEGRVCFLPQVWNYLCAGGNDMEKKADSSLYQEWSEARYNHKIWHYAGGEKDIPCNCPTVDGAEHFWKYAVNTPFMEELFSRLDKDIDKKVKSLEKEKKSDEAYRNAEYVNGHSNWFKTAFKKVVPYGSPMYIAVKKIYFGLKKKKYDPAVDIIHSKILNKDKQKVKIYVSRRIDLNSNVVNNPVFQDIRCGAEYDEQPSLFLGDDTGNNISHLRMPFCEMTVVYWAWKNEDADYYGLCHYRRYITFCKSQKKLNTLGYIDEKELNERTIKKYKLNKKSLYEKMAPKADIWITVESKLKGSDFLVAKGETVFDVFMTHPAFYNPSYSIYTLKLIDEFFPEYSKPAHDYISQDTYYAYNCFIMTKELFNKMCEFMFGVLFRLNDKYDFSFFEGNKMRTPGYMSELLYGIFVTWAIQQGYNVKKTQLVFFEDTTMKSNLSKKERLDLKRHNYLFEHSREYRVIADNNFRIQQLQGQLNQLSINNDRGSGINKGGLTAACFAEQLHTYHKTAFEEFKNRYTDKAVAIIAPGATLSYYRRINDITHIGVNEAFTFPGVKPDIHFTSVFEDRPDWIEKLKDHDFVKFFGQYSAGASQREYCADERIVSENNGRRFFLGAPKEELQYDIEFYPLAGYYTNALQAIHFALYTNAKRIYLVGCDCGISDGRGKTALKDEDKKAWKKGYRNIKSLAERFCPDTEIISVNPVGLKGLFHDVYTKDFLEDNPDISREFCEIVDFNTIEAEMENKV